MSIVLDTTPSKSSTQSPNCVNKNFFNRLMLTIFQAITDGSTIDQQKATAARRRELQMEEDAMLRKQQMEKEKIEREERERESRNARFQDIDDEQDPRDIRPVTPAGTSGVAAMGMLGEDWDDDGESDSSG